MSRGDLRRTKESCYGVIGEVKEEELKKMAGAGTEGVEPRAIYHSITFCFTLEIGNHSCYPASKKC
ncbi:hypothetical protein AAG068_18545 [Bacillus paramycoides]|uniref:hypothetical protein n=1 Tax=Bacillus paramycoides TaxID=2026194 RepID=UPI0031835A1F